AEPPPDCVRRDATCGAAANPRSTFQLAAMWGQPPGGCRARDTVRGMERTALGRTGIQVSRFCLGAMMFGAWGNTDHDDCIRIVHRALDAGINFITPPTSTLAGSPRRSWAKPSGAVAATVWCWAPRYTGRWAMPPTSSAILAAGS